MSDNSLNNDQIESDKCCILSKLYHNNSSDNNMMILRSKCKCSVIKNPFDLSSNCSDDIDYIDTDSLHSQTKNSSELHSENSVLSSDFIASIVDSDTRDSGYNPEEYQQVIKKPLLAFNYELRQRYPKTSKKDSNPPSPLPIIKDSHSNSSPIPEISVKTLVDILSGRYSCYLSQTTIIDCRFPYEYNSGHISGAINLFTIIQLIQKFMDMPDTLNCEELVDSMLEYLHFDFVLPNNDFSNNNGALDSHAFIFYCEFSSVRAPKMAHYLRGLDRLSNADIFPRLKLPLIYVVHGGYKDFFTKYPEHCEPRGYMTMTQTPYSLRSPSSRSSFSPSKPVRTGLLLPEADDSVMTTEAGPSNQTPPIKPPQSTQGSPVSQFTSSSSLLLQRPTTPPAKHYRKQEISCKRLLADHSQILLNIIQNRTKYSTHHQLFSFEDCFI